MICSQCRGSKTYSPLGMISVKCKECEGSGHRINTKPQLEPLMQPLPIVKIKPEKLIRAHKRKSKQ